MKPFARGDFNKDWISKCSLIAVPGAGTLPLHSLLYLNEDHIFLIARFKNTQFKNIANRRAKKKSCLNLSHR